MVVKDFVVKFCRVTDIYSLKIDVSSNRNQCIIRGKYNAYFTVCYWEGQKQMNKILWTTVLVLNETFLFDFSKMNKS